MSLAKKLAEIRATIAHLFNHENEAVHETAVKAAGQIDALKAEVEADGAHLAQNAEKAAAPVAAEAASDAAHLGAEAGHDAAADAKEATSAPQAPAEPDAQSTPSGEASAQA